jgi:hypothetical protein
MVSAEHLQLQSILPSFYDESFPCLRYVDAYGKTLFNRLQMPQLLKEIHRLYRDHSSGEAGEAILALGDLVEKCQRSVGHYIRFEGD